MFKFIAVGGLITLNMMTAPVASAAVTGDCPNDSKSLGLIRVATDDAADSWWGITKQGLIAAGFVTEQQQINQISSWFGTAFETLSAAVGAVVAAVEPIDANGNGYVCAATLRGTRAHFRDPFITLTAFGVSDDKLKK